MAKVKYYGTWDAKGKLQARAFENALDSFRSRRAPVVLTVEDDKGKRTTPQNSYYWLCLTMMGDGLKDLGWEPNKCTKEAVHDMVAREFLTVDEPGLSGVLLRRVKSTTELNTKEFSEYMDHVIRYAAENIGVELPEAGQQMELAA